MEYYAVFKLVGEKLFCIAKFETEEEAIAELKLHSHVTILKMHV